MIRPKVISVVHIDPVVAAASVDVVAVVPRAIINEYMFFIPRFLSLERLGKDTRMTNNCQMHLENSQKEHKKTVSRRGQADVCHSFLVTFPF